MPTRQQFIARLQELTASTPYRVSETAEGCELTLDLANGSWHGLFAEHHLSKVYSHQIAVDEQSGTLSVTDVSQEVEWTTVGPGEASVPVASGRNTAKGRLVERSNVKIYGWDDNGQYGEQLAYAFNSEESRALIDKVVAEQGWKTRMGSSQKIGMIVGLAAVGLVVVAGLVVLLVMLL